MIILKRNLLPVCFLSLLLSCGGNSSSDGLESNASNYKLEIVDSIQLNILGRLSVVDVHSETGDLLIIQSDPPKLWIVSQEGEVKETWAKKGDGPDEIGPYLLSAEFFGEGVAMMGYLRLKVFNKSFKAIGSYKPNFDLNGMLYMGYNHLMAFESGGEQQLVTYFGGPQTDKKFDTPEFLEEFNIVDVINPELEGEVYSEKGLTKAVFSPIGELTDDSYFKRSGRAFMIIKPVFDVREETLIYALEGDTVIHKRGLPDGELISSTPIPFDEFYMTKGWTMGQAVAEMNSARQNPGDRPGNIDRLFHIDGFDIIFYRSGLPLERLNAIELEGIEKAREEYRLDYSKYLILQEGKRLNKELRTTEKINPPSVADDAGFIWASQNINALEEEPDLVTIYKLKIVADE